MLRSTHAAVGGEESVSKIIEAVLVVAEFAQTRVDIEP
jgi:hypothetical protein